MNNCQGCSSRHLSCLPGGFVTQSEAGRCSPSYRTTHLVPADAFTVLAVADHQAAQLSTGISIRLRLSRAPGTIYKANRIGFSPYGSHCRQGEQCKQSQKMLWSIKRHFDSLFNRHWFWTAKTVMTVLRWVILSGFCGRRKKKTVILSGSLSTLSEMLGWRRRMRERLRDVTGGLFLLLSHETWSLSSESNAECHEAGWCSVELVILCGDKLFI